MKYKLTNRNLKRADALTKEYREVFDAIIGHTNDEELSKEEVNWQLSKSLSTLEEAQKSGKAVDELTSHNIKKYALEETRRFKNEHDDYEERSFTCNQITNSCYISVIFYSIFLILLNSYLLGNKDRMIFVVTFAAFTILFLIRKICLSLKIRLPFLYAFGDIIMIAIVTFVSVMSSYYFMIFLWLYDLFFMIYLQKVIVEKKD